MAADHKCSPACTAGWQPSRKCHCQHCGENFSTPSNFDKHIDRRPGALFIICVPPTGVGLVLNARGIWTMPGEADIRERFDRV